jgi:molybdate transport system ATP-binding protein
LDEPFQFLDDKQKQNLNHYLHRHLRPDSTLILITHYADDLAQWTNFTKSMSNEQ